MEVIIPIILSGCGLVMISSLSLRKSMSGGNPYAPPLRQFQFLGLGLTLMLCCAMTQTEFFRKHCGKLWFISIVLLGLTLIPGIGIEANGARRWLSLLGFRFQPFEVLLFTLPIFMADRLNAERHKEILDKSSFKAFLKPTLMIAGISGFMIFRQPSLGGTIIVISICFIMHIENRGWKWPLTGALVGVAGIALAILVAPYRLKRFRAFWDPWEDPTNAGFQIIQGLIAFANGSLTGVGIGRGLQEESYLPEADTDYIFPAIGEEFGLLGTLFLTLLYALWTWRAFYIYKNAKNPFLKSLALGLTASVIFPMFMNVAGVTKIMPLSGIPMPFLSAGGTSMIFMWLKVGLLMAIKRETREANEKEK